MSLVCDKLNPLTMPMKVMNWFSQTEKFTFRQRLQKRVWKLVKIVLFFIIGGVLYIGHTFNLTGRSFDQELASFFKRQIDTIQLAAEKKCEEVAELDKSSASNPLVCNRLGVSKGQATGTTSVSK